jgi:hypothetical protein
VTKMEYATTTDIGINVSYSILFFSWIHLWNDFIFYIYSLYTWFCLKHSGN